MSDVFILRAEAEANGDKRPSLPHDALLLDYWELRRGGLLVELRFIEGQLQAAGRISRLTVAAARQR